MSWVSRRLALVELLPEAIQQQVREGKIAAQVAMKFLVPVARKRGRLPAHGGDLAEHRWIRAKPGNCMQPGARDRPRSGNASLMSRRCFSKRSGKRRRKLRLEPPPIGSG